MQKRVLTRKSFSASPFVLFPVCQDAHSRTSLTTHHCSQHPFLHGLQKVPGKPCRMLSRAGMVSNESRASRTPL